VRVDVVRDRATLARIVDGGQVENVYRLQLMNATESVQRYTVSVEGIPGAQLASAAEAEAGPAEARWITVAVRVPHAAARAQGSGAHPIHFDIHVQGSDRHVRERSTFVVPRL
jgi:polyferredoxin